jgi:hypothetical protein
MRPRLAFFLPLIVTFPLLGWGPEGHSLVARLAAAHLTPAASAKVQEILGPGVTLASVSSWADQVRNQRRETGPWHYVDIPIDKPHLEMARDCPAKEGCVISKIEEFEKMLADPALTPAQKKEPLMFLVHFIGDMHQPLHCSDNKDRGGNEVRLDFFGRNMNLHSVWDGGLLGRLPTEDQEFAEFSKDLTDSRANKWGKGTVRDWAEESHKTAVKIVYGKLPKASSPIKITPDYEKKADPVVRQQIEHAGARLAAALNAALK